MSLDLSQRYPSISDLRARARRRVPHFAWEFVESGTGDDDGVQHNRDAFRAIKLTPSFMQGQFEPDLTTTLFGTRYRAPFGISPVGMSGLIWPGTDRILARCAATHRVPFCMSTAANEAPETLGPLADGMGWFQLYPPRNRNICQDLLARARDAGFTTLLVTVDVPAISRRERQMRAGIGAGFRLRPSTIAQCAMRPAWSLATLRNGTPGLPGLEQYAPSDDTREFLAYIGRELNGTLDWDYVATLCQLWEGPVVLKGILDPADARQAVSLGVDGILVSNHGARQLDGAPASIEALPSIVEAVAGSASVLLDSGVRSGLDIARAIALGADFVLLGRAFMFGVAALGEAGGEHTVELLMADLRTNMSNLGCRTPGELRARLTDALR